MPKKKSLRTIDDLLSEITPVDASEVQSWYRTRHGQLAGSEIQMSAKTFPVPPLIRYILVSCGCKDLGRAEKTAWQYPFTHGDWLFIVSHRKFGLRLSFSYPTDSQDAANAWARSFLGRLAASQRSAELLLADVADRQIAEGNVTLQNQYQALRLTYEYFREGAQLALDGKGRIPEKAPGGGFWIAREEREAFYNIVAMCGAYFSVIEHVLVLSIPFFAEHNSKAIDVREVIKLSWADKYRYVLGDLTGIAGDYFSRLNTIAERYRNTYGHGAFGKDCATTYFHAPGVGAIPGNMTRVRHSPQFSLVPAAESDFTKVCAVFDGWEAEVADILMWPAWTWIQAGLDVRYDREFCSKVNAAFEAERFDQFVDEEAAQWEWHVNMEY
ncbi:hypothetical protein ACTWP6_30080 [Mycobacterium sp. 4D054]|uniref:hypothetical protein n=1 Tax=Mycobacterium sp. 4D054 TaxID=3457440 RepID=UPI003FD39293